jgi:hypothetical protein
MTHEHHTHTDDVYEHPIAHHDPQEGFDRGEPRVGAIFAFTIGSVLILVLVIVALQNYFEDIYQKAVYEKVLSVPSEQLQDLRNRDAWNLTHYMYGDLNKASGRVRIPIDRAMQLFAGEAGAGKLFYPAKPTVPKKEEPEASPAGAAASAAATPAAAAPAQ